MCNLSVTYDVHYGWAIDYGLLGSITNPTSYTTDTALIFVEAAKPQNLHPDAAATTTAHTQISNNLND